MGAALLSKPHRPRIDDLVAATRLEIPIERRKHGRLTDCISGRQVFKFDVLAPFSLFPRLSDALEETLVIFEAVIQPIIFVSEADEDGSGLAMPRDNHMVL